MTFEDSNDFDDFDMLYIVDEINSTALAITVRYVTRCAHCVVQDE